MPSFLLIILLFQFHSREVSPGKLVPDCRLRDLTIHEYENDCPVGETSDEECPGDEDDIMCCLCHGVCCSESVEDGSKDESAIIFPRNAAATSSVAVISTKNSTVDDSDGGQKNVSKPTTIAVVQGIAEDKRVVTRIRRNSSKTNRGTGEDVVIDDDDEDKNKRNESFSRKEIEDAITTGEMEDSGRNENDTTTVPPPVESCSSKSKRCDEPEPDLLDEFFPPKNHGKGAIKGKGRRRRREIQIVLPFRPRFEEIKNGVDFGSSGGLIAKGEISVVEKTTRTLIPIDYEVTTVEPMEFSTETVTEEAKRQRPTKPPSPNATTAITPRPAQRKMMTAANNSDEEEVSSQKPPQLVSSSLLVPKVRPGKCESLTGNMTCLALLPDASQCTMDSECEGTKKCCFYGCKPYDKVGICSLPVFFSSGWLSEKLLER